ncbi:MAG: hypothetical protein NTY77_05910 [Elusimicrobia bacterium]|nr:hypothetical protein [Elusimicrobiota bacterium]
MSVLLPEPKASDVRQSKKLAALVCALFLLSLCLYGLFHYWPTRFPHMEAAGEICMGATLIVIGLSSIIEGKGFSGAGMLISFWPAAIVDQERNPFSYTLGVIISVVAGCSFFIHGIWSIWKHG